MGQLRAQDQREIKGLKQKLRRKEEAVAEVTALKMATKKSRPLGERTGTTEVGGRSAEGPYPHPWSGGQCWRRLIAGESDAVDDDKGDIATWLLIKTKRNEN